MSNPCRCTLTVSGDPGRVAQLMAECRTDEHTLAFAAVAPPPSTLRDDQADWCLTWWGTRSAGTGTVQPGHEPGQVCWDFDTHDSPPWGFAVLLSSRYPDLFVHLVWSEPGNGLAGRAEFVGGVVVEDVDVDEDWTDGDTGEMLDAPQVTEHPVDVAAVRAGVTAQLATSDPVDTAAVLLDGDSGELACAVDLLADALGDRLVRQACRQVLAGRPLRLVGWLLHHTDPGLARAGAALYALAPLVAPAGPIARYSAQMLGRAAHAGPPVTLDALEALVSADAMTVETVTALAPDWAGDAVALIDTVTALTAV